MEGEKGNDVIMIKKNKRKIKIIKKNVLKGPREVVHQLRVCITLAEDMSSVLLLRSVSWHFLYLRFQRI